MKNNEKNINSIVKFIPENQIGSAGFHFGAKEKQYVLEVLDSHRLSYGPWSQKFELLEFRIRFPSAGFLREWRFAASSSLALDEFRLDVCSL